MQQQWTVFLFGLMNRYILHVSCKVGLVKNVNSRVLPNSSALVFLLNYQKIVDVFFAHSSYMVVYASQKVLSLGYVTCLIIIERIVLQFSHITVPLILSATVPILQGLDLTILYILPPEVIVDGFGHVGMMLCPSLETLPQSSSEHKKWIWW